VARRTVRLRRIADEEHWRQRSSPQAAYLVGRVSLHRSAVEHSSSLGRGFGPRPPTTRRFVIDERGLLGGAEHAGGAEVDEVDVALVAADAARDGLIDSGDRSTSLACQCVLSVPSGTAVAFRSVESTGGSCRRLAMRCPSGGSSWGDGRVDG